MFLENTTELEGRSIYIPANERGLGLVGAIFVIVVVSLLSIAMAKMIEIDQEIYSYEILAAKAFLSAESGAQLGINRIISPAGGGSCVDRTFTFTEAALRSCTAVVSCTTETVGTDSYYTITSNGACIAGNYVTRRSVQLRIAP